METAMTAMARIAVAFLPVLLAAHPVQATQVDYAGLSRDRAKLGLDEARIRRLAADDTRITFLDYDWRLNRVP